MINEGYTGTQLEANLMASAERQIGDLYRLHLGRDPDQGGLEFYLNQVNSGTPISSVKIALQESPSCVAQCL